jgi:hypothetical protein
MSGEPLVASITPPKATCLRPALSITTTTDARSPRFLPPLHAGRAALLLPPHLRRVNLQCRAELLHPLADKGDLLCQGA